MHLIAVVTSRGGEEAKGLANGLEKALKSGPKPLWDPAGEEVPADEDHREGSFHGAVGIVKVDSGRLNESVKHVASLLADTLDAILRLKDAVAPSRMSVVIDFPLWKYDGRKAWENATRPALVAALSCGFPEAHFVVANQSAEWPADAHRLDVVPGTRDIDLARLARQITTFAATDSQVFDGYGLRAWAMMWLVQHARGKELVCFGRVTDYNSVLTIDDERDYALYHGLLAYTWGFGAHAVSSMSGFKAVVTLNSRYKSEAPDGPIPAGAPRIAVTIEDLQVEFADSGKFDQHMRTQEFENLWHEKKRIFITSNRDGVEVDARSLEKPLDQLSELEREITDFCKAGRPEPQAASARTHTVPGLVLMVAEFMVGRSRACLTRNGHRFENIVGAVLARDAGRLLNRLAPTLSVEALALRWEHTIRAETVFIGAEVERDSKQMWKAIEKDLEAICEATGAKRSGALLPSSKAQVADRLLSTFASVGRAKDEDDAAARARWHHLQVRWKQSREFRRWHRIPALGVEHYAIWSVHSLARLALVIGIGFIVCTGLYLWALPGNVRSLETAALMSLTSFLLPGVPNGHESLFNGNYSSGLWFFCDAQFWRWLLVLASIVAGVINVGVFVSHLYSVAVRRR